jgi:hypothetical protein
VNAPADSRGDAKKNMLKAMRPLPTQHYWNVYFDRCVPFMVGTCPAQSPSLTTLALTN